MTKGILLVDKPAGWTSFDVVNKVRRLVAEAAGKKPKNIKVGHTGTLDPFATGLLVILIGKDYTKKAQSLSADDKTYEFTVRMGQESTTGDPEGDISECSTADQSSVLKKEDLEESCKSWIGTVYQTPPVFSAIKINGTRAYDLARSGHHVEMPKRKVEVKTLRLESFEPPFFSATATVSKGTYIRSLAEDICKSHGTCGYVTELRRTAAGVFRIEDAIHISKDTTIADIQRHVLSLD